LRRAGDAYLKLECWQPTGSFKVRGATHVLACLSPEERRRGVVAASAGNHALGVAFAVQVLGGQMDATLFVPETAPRAKVEKPKGFPVTVHEEGATYDDAHALAMAHMERTGATYVHAFDDPRTAAGQGTAGLEILDDLPDVGAILVPVGGGGLISGVAAAVKARAPAVRIVAVQPEASPALPESIRQGRPLLEYPAGPTLADGLAARLGRIVHNHRDRSGASRRGNGPGRARGGGPGRGGRWRGGGGGGVRALAPPRRPLDPPACPPRHAVSSAVARLPARQLRPLRSASGGPAPPLR